MRQDLFIKHDINATSDLKIIKLLSRYGLKGYGTYWVILENLFKTSGFLSKKDVVEIIEFTTKETEINDIIQYIIDIGLLKEQGENVYSKRLLEQLGKMAELADISRANGNKGGRPKNPDKTQQVIKNNPDITQSEPRRNQNKNKNKNKNKNFKNLNLIPPSPTSSSSEAEVLEEKNLFEGENPIPKKPEPTEEGRKYAEWFRALLPTTMKLTLEEVEGWGRAYDELVRIDNRLPEEIYKVSKWARVDDFWSTNFMSPGKLRRKNKDGVWYYDVFLARMGKDDGDLYSKKNYSPHDQKPSQCDYSKKTWE